jgi:hypothetical protein
MKEMFQSESRGNLAADEILAAISISIYIYKTRLVPYMCVHIYIYRVRMPQQHPQEDWL